MEDKEGQKELGSPILIQGKDIKNKEVLKKGITQETDKAEQKGNSQKENGPERGERRGIRQPRTKIDREKRVTTKERRNKNFK